MTHSGIDEQIAELQASSINYGVYVGLLERTDLTADDRARLIDGYHAARARMLAARAALVPMEMSDARP